MENIILGIRKFYKQQWYFMCRYPKLKRSCNPERQIIQFFALTGNLYFKFSFFGSAITYIFVICQPPFLVLSCLDLHLCQKQPATNSDPK